MSTPCTYLAPPMQQLNWNMHKYTVKGRTIWTKVEWILKTIWRAKGTNSTSWMNARDGSAFFVHARRKRQSEEPECYLRDEELPWEGGADRLSMDHVRKILAWHWWNEWHEQSKFVSVIPDNWKIKLSSKIFLIQIWFIKNFVLEESRLELNTNPAVVCRSPRTGSKW